MSNQPTVTPGVFGGKARNIPVKNTLLLPYQAKWVLDDSIMKIMEKSRQIGISWATAYDLDRRQSQKDARLDAWVSSRDEIQARLFLEDCKSFANLLNLGAEDLGEKVVDDKGNNAFVLQFANGVRIHSMSSNPNAQAGKRGSRVLDEFALHNDQRLMYSIAEPGITWGGFLGVISTQRGSDSYFNQLLIEAREKGNPKGFSVHRVTLQDALDQGFLYKLQSKLSEYDPRQQMDEADYFNYIKNRAADEETFLQEYMCIPSDDSTAFLSYELIDGCTYKLGTQAREEWQSPDLAFGKDVYCGLDIGRKSDLTVVYVLEKLGDVAYERKRIELKSIPFSTQESIIYPWFEHARRIAIDATGLGMQFAERAAERFGKYKVEEITFNPAMKEELAYPVRGAFEDKRVRIDNDQKLIADLRNIRKEQTSGTYARFAGERNSNGHADRFWALALALHAAKSTVDPVLPRLSTYNHFPRSSARRNRSISQ